MLCSRRSSRAVWGRPALNDVHHCRSYARGRIGLVSQMGTASLTRSANTSSGPVSAATLQAEQVHLPRLQVRTMPTKILYRKKPLETKAARLTHVGIHRSEGRGYLELGFKNKLERYRLPRTGEDFTARFTNDTTTVAGLSGMPQIDTVKIVEQQQRTWLGRMWDGGMAWVRMVLLIGALYVGYRLLFFGR